MTNIKTKIIELPTFEQLTSEEQEKVIENYYDFNVDFSWWDCTYEDAKDIGLLLTGFNLDKGSIEGHFESHADDCANNIIKLHGDATSTYIAAKEHLEKVQEVLAKYKGDAENPECEDELNELDADLEGELKLAYFYMLKNEYEYLTSEEAIRESLIANEYTFNRETLKIDS